MSLLHQVTEDLQDLHLHTQHTSKEKQAKPSACRGYGIREKFIDLTEGNASVNLNVLYHNVRSHLDEEDPSALRYTALKDFCLRTADVHSVAELNLHLMYSGKHGLKDLPLELGAAGNLRTLICSGHNFTKIPGVVTRLPNLQVLSLSGNSRVIRIDDEARIVLAELAHLEVLHLNSTFGTRQGAAELELLHFPLMPELQSLHLAFRIGVNSNFPEGYPLDESLPKLKHLDLQGSCLSCENVALPIHRSLTSIDLSLCFNPNLRGSNSRDLKLIEEIELRLKKTLEAFSVIFPSLEVLILDSNQNNFRIENLIVKLVSVIEQKKKIQVRKHSAYVSPSFLELFPVCENVKDVSLRNCQLTTFPFIAFEKFPNALRFDFSKNPFVAENPRPFLKALTMKYNNEGFSPWEITELKKGPSFTGNTFVISRKCLGKRAAEYV